jgi:hypothetical protein
MKHQTTATHTSQENKTKQNFLTTDRPTDRPTKSPMKEENSSLSSPPKTSSFVQRPKTKVMEQIAPDLSLFSR